MVPKILKVLQDWKLDSVLIWAFELLFGFAIIIVFDLGRKTFLNYLGTILM